MGRPKLAESKKRSKLVPPFRLTAAELKKVKAAAKKQGLTISAYLRKRVML